MTSKLDQSLDTIISSERSASKTTARRGGRGGATNGSGPVRHARSRPSTGPYQRNAPGMVAGFSTPYVANTAAHLAAAQFAAMQQQQQQQIAMQQQAAQKMAAAQQRQQQQQQQQQQSANESASKKVVGDTIHITGLATDVKSDELKEIFGSVGAIKSAVVNYSESGQSMGTATVTFRRQADADKAVAEYDGAEIDGKTMSCKLIATVSSGPVVVKKKKPQSAAGQQSTPQLPPGFVAATGPAFNPMLAAPFSFPAATAGFPLQPNFSASVFNQSGYPSAFNAFSQQRGGGASAYRGGRQPQQQQQQQRQPQQTARGGGAAGRGAAGGRGGRGGSGRGGRGGSNGGGRGPQKEASAADLDAELDSYHGSKETEETKAAE